MTANITANYNVATTTFQATVRYPLVIKLLKTTISCPRVSVYEAHDDQYRLTRVMRRRAETRLVVPRDSMLREIDVEIYHIHW